MSFEGSANAESLPPIPQSLDTDNQILNQLQTQLGSCQLPKSVALLFSVQITELDTTRNRESLDQQVLHLKTALQMINSLSTVAP